MSKDMFFAAYIKDGQGNARGMAVRISPEEGPLPGSRIKSLTEAARQLPLNESERLRNRHTR